MIDTVGKAMVWAASASRVGVAFTTERNPGETYAHHEALRSLVRAAALAAGFGDMTPAVPLSSIISPGDVVLLKPNWVLHYNKSGATMDCMVTHPAFILAVLAEVVAAGARRVIIADAPIQSAEFDKLAPPDWCAAAAGIAGKTALDILDFRSTVSSYQGSMLVSRGGLRDPERFVEFDLGKDSLLERISTPAGRFRNTSYNADDLARVQRPGVHRFLLCKEPFEVDVVLNLPKLKAHAKAGVTAALKNLVGINGDKNFLPHHRIGGSAIGGDCYKGFKPFKRIGEALLDAANRRIGTRGYVIAGRAGMLMNAVHGGDLEGKWWGNDTTWRMVLDLNRLLVYGDADGKLHDAPRRQVYSLTDAIVAGERNGPLAPEPAPLGAVTFASNSVHADAAHLALMRFDIERVPLVREAFAAMRYPLVAQALGATEVCCDGRRYTLDSTAEELGRDFRPPDGWLGRVEGPSHKRAATH